MSVPVVRLGRPETSSLGVVMMAGAIAFGALAWCAAAIGVVDELCGMAISDAGMPGLLGRADGATCMVAAALTIARSLLGYRAGRALAVGQDARARLAAYATVGLAHAVAVAVLVAPTWSRVEVSSLAAALATLPVLALAVLPLPPSNAARGGDAVPSIAVLAGLVALVLALALALPSVRLTSASLSAADEAYVLVPPLQALMILGTGLGVIAVSAAIAIAIVGLGLLRAGVSSSAVAIDRATRVAGFVGFVLAVALSLLVVTAVAIPAVVALAMALPQQLRRASTGTSADPAGRRAALGWILLGHGALAAAALLPSVVDGAPTTLVATVIAAPTTAGSPQLGLALAAVELGAAVALIGRLRIALAVTWTWAAAALAVCISVDELPGAWMAIVPVAALIATRPVLTETLRARARLVRSLRA